jgi:cobalt-zinc-cadmium efflux system membrane fusion protein
MKRRAAVAAILALWLGVAGCGRRPEPAEGPAKGQAGGAADEHGAGADAEASENEIRIAKEMLRDLRITTAPVESRQGGEGTNVLGELHVDEDRYAEVSAPIAAQALRLRAALGDTVKTGQPLVELASLEVGKARGEQRAAAARRALAEQALARKRGLADEQIAPRREVEEAEAELRSAEAALAAATAALASLGVSPAGEGAGFELRAPVSGTVLERSVVRGQVVEPGRVLFRIGDLAALWLVAHASERDALRVPLGAAARVAFPALPGRSFTGRVTLVGRQVDPASRTIPVRLAVANEGGVLRPGMSATAWLPIGEGEPLLAVPAAALQRLHDAWCVFVPKAEGVFEVRRVARGRDLGGEVEILSGLAPGETVVVEGAFLIKAEGEKAEGEGGHHDH